MFPGVESRSSGLRPRLGPILFSGSLGVGSNPTLVTNNCRVPSVTILVLILCTYESACGCLAVVTACTRVGLELY